MIHMHITICRYCHHHGPILISTVVLLDRPRLQPSTLMAFQLYLQPQPRALFLVSEHHTLLIQHPDIAGHGRASSEKQNPSTIVEFLPVDQVNFDDLIKVNKARNIGGVLGLLSVPSGTWLHCRLSLTPSDERLMCYPFSPGIRLFRDDGETRGLPVGHFR